MELTAANVREVFNKCVCDPNAPDVVKIDGLVIIDFPFDPKKILEHKEDIFSMLLQLPDTFMLSKSEPVVNIVTTHAFFDFIKKGTSGPIEMFYQVLPGRSFCYAFLTNENVHWGEHPNMQELVVLGIAIGKLKIVYPRPIWPYLHGSVPHIIVIDDDQMLTKHQNQLLPLLDDLSEKFLSELSTSSDEVLSVDKTDDQTDFDIQSAQNDFDDVTPTEPIMNID